MGVNIYQDLEGEFKLPFEPYDYQHTALNEAAEFDKLLLHLKVGRGKTAMATWLGLYHSLNNGVEKMLFLVPATLVIQWARWLRSVQFIDGDPLDVLTYKGTPKQRAEMNFDHDCIVMSHQIFVKDYKVRIARELSKDPNIFVTYDESQNGLRKVGNKIWRYFNYLTLNKRVVLLSGTPVSTPMDVYGVVKLLNPQIYPSKRKFLLCHVKEEDYFGNIVEWKNLEMMHEALYKNAVTIPDSAVAELPGLIVDTIPYELAPKHRKLYDELVQEQILKTDNGKIIDATETTRMFHTLQRFVTSPHKMDLKSVRANLFAMLKQVYEEDDSKLIVFSNYRDTNQGVLEFFLKEGINAVGVWGEISSGDKQRNKDAFIDDPDVRVMVGNPESLGVGTDGMQHSCYREVYTELPLTPPRFEQSTGRVYRDGQKEVCVIRCLVAQDTIQQNLYYSLINKDDLLSQLIKQKLDLREVFG